MSTGTLVHNNVYRARVSPHAVPGLLVVHLGAVRLLCKEVQVVFQLRVGHARTEDSHRTELVEGGQPTIVVEHAVNGRPSAVWCARGRHDDDAYFMLSPVVPECCLLLHARKVGAADDVEVRSTSGGAPSYEYVRSAAKAAAYLAHIVSWR